MPRLINRICDRALYLAWLKRSSIVDAHMLQAAMDYVGHSVPPTSLHQRPPRRTHWRDGSGERFRSQTYMQGLGRSLTKKLSIAAVVLIGVAGVVTGATYISDALAALAEPVAPPLPPMLPVVVPAVTPPPAPVTEPGAAGAYRVEVALFTRNAGAGRAVAELMEAGLPARQQPLTLSSGGTMQQVILGPFETLEEAETYLRRVRETGGYRDARIVAQGSPEK